MLFIHQERGKAPLPQMAFPFFSKINLPRVTSMGLTDCPAKTFWVIRNSNQVHMVWHQAISPYFNAVFTTPLGHELDVIPVITITEKCILPAVSTLCYMMGIMLCNDSRNTCHASFLYLSTPSVNQKLVWCPLISHIMDVPRFPDIRAAHRRNPRSVTKSLLWCGGEVSHARSLNDLLL